MALDATLDLDPKLYLDVGGRRFGGWLRVRVERSIDNACTQFGVIATRSWPGAEEQWWIEPGDRVEVRVNDEIVCTGWIDLVSPSYSGDAHSIEISGRGLVCDLVDCSYLGPPWQWKNSDPAEVIRAIVAQFDIPVTFDVDLGEPFDFTIQQGEAGWEAIDRICRLRQVLAYDQPDGSLLITRGSEEVCEPALVQGDNIYAATGTLDDRDRFSLYVVKGQQPGTGDTSPEQAAQSVGEIADPSVRRFRPMLLVQSADTDNGTALDRAKWEMQNRWGKARTATITVTGWLRPDGSLWPINRLCDVVDDWLGLDRRLAITGSVLEAGAGGLRTILTLAPPEALTPAPPDVETTPKAKPDGAGGGGGSFWEQVAADRRAGEARRKEAKQ